MNRRKVWLLALLMVLIGLSVFGYLFLNQKETKDTGYTIPKDREHIEYKLNEDVSLIAVSPTTVPSAQEDIVVLNKEKNQAEKVFHSYDLLKVVDLDNGKFYNAPDGTTYFAFYEYVDINRASGDNNTVLTHGYLYSIDKNGKTKEIYKTSGEIDGIVLKDGQLVIYEKEYIISDSDNKPKHLMTYNKIEKVLLNGQVVEKGRTTITPKSNED